MSRAAAARKTRKRRAHFGRRVVAKAVVAVLLVAVFASAVTAFLAYTSARQVEAQVVAEFSAGQTQLQDGKSLLQKATKDNSPTELEQARQDFTSARKHFDRAPALLSQNVFLNASTSFGVPYLAPRLKAAKSLAVMGSSLSNAALIGVEIDSLLVHPSGTSSAGPFQVLTKMSTKIPNIKSDLATALQAAQSVDPSVLPSSQAATLATAIDSIRSALKSVDQLGGLLPVATEILGGNGQRTYLIEQVTNAELRAGGGFIGSFSVLTANAGQLKLVMGGDIGTYEYPRKTQGQAGYVQPPGPLQSFIGRDSFGLADSNFFPDFATSAQWGEKFAETELHVKPDGIISIDPDVVAALLSVTGPLKVPGENVTVDSGNFINWLFQQQYSQKNVTANKKAVFGAMASVLIPDMLTLSPSRWPDLMTQLNNMATERHLQVYFNNAAAQSTMAQYGWSGKMNPTDAADYVYEVESNFGATKANHFITRTFAVDLSVANGVLHHSVTLSLKNSEPAGYEGGNNYNCYLRFYVPAVASGLSITNIAANKFPDATIPAGYQHLDGWFEIDVGYRGYGTRVIHIQWDTRWDGSAASHTIYWQKQPGTEHDAISVAWHDSGHTFSAQGTLDTDKQIVLTPTSLTIAAGQAASATVPSLSL